MKIFGILGEIFYSSNENFLEATYRLELAQWLNFTLTFFALFIIIAPISLYVYQLIKERPDRLRLRRSKDRFKLSQKGNDKLA